MVLSSIYLKNFRIHQDTQLSFSGQLNYIIGGNGQGKTSILEAIYYLCTTKSSIAKFDNEAVKFRENEFEIIGKFRELTENTTRLFYSLKENKKYCFQNGKQISIICRYYWQISYSIVSSSRSFNYSGFSD